MNDNYWQNLPKKRMGAGALFFDKENRLLIVKPTYKDGWIIPGGVVNENESPREACIREIKEEIGLDIINIEFLGIHYRRDIGSHKGENLQFIFYGGILNPIEINKINLQKEELSEYKFAKIEEALPLFSEGLSKRVKICVEEALKENKPIYLEDAE